MSVNGWVPVGPSCVYNGQLVDSGKSAPVSGRVTAIALHPTEAETVYVGTATGGVWKSTNNGVSWEAIMDTQISLAVGAMAFDPGNADKLYIATGEGNDAGEALASSGILVYTANLGTWNLVGFADLAGTRIRRIVVENVPASPNRILLASDKGLLESVDDGGSFHPLNVMPGTAPGTIQISDIAYDPVAKVLLAVVRKGNVYRQEAGGAFIPAAPQVCNDAKRGRAALAMCKNTPSRVYAVYADTDGGTIGVYSSTDAGKTWSADPSTPGAKDMKQGNYNLALTVDPNNPDIVFLAEKRVWRSDNGTKSWEKVSDSEGDIPGIHADQHAVEVCPTNSMRVWVGNDGGAWFSIDGGKSFVHRNRGLQTFQYYSIAQHPDDPSLMLAGAQDNGTQRYEGGAAWNLVEFGDGFFCAIDSVEKNRWYASYCFMNNGDVKAIMRSDKAGERGSFDYCVSGITNTFTDYGTNLKPGKDTPFYVPFIIDPNNHKVLYLGTNLLYRSAEYGNEWQPVLDQASGAAFTTGPHWDQTITAIAVTPNDSTCVWVGTYDGRVFMLEHQNGLTFKVTELTAGLVAANWPVGEYISDLAPAPVATPGATPRTNRVYIGIGAAQTTYMPVKPVPLGRIWVSYWDPAGAGSRKMKSLMTPPPQLERTLSGQTVTHALNPVNAIVLDPDDPTTVYIGCNSGVFKGTSEGTTWVDFNGMAPGGVLPNVAIGDLQFHKKSRLLRAATMGRSVWERVIPDPVGGDEVDLYIRDNIVDVGMETTGPEYDDPFAPGEKLTAFSGADIKVDTPWLGIGSFQTIASTEDYTANTRADYIAFPQFSSDNFRRSVISRVYAQIMSRGPKPATEVKVRAFVSSKDVNGYPNLVNGFWTDYLTRPADQFGAWKALGATVDLETILPAQPKVANWSFEMPSEMPDTVGVLVIATCKEDPVAFPVAPGLEVDPLVKDNKRVALREAQVNMSTGAIVAITLTVVGLCALGVVGGLAAAHKI
jgi:photosystem II stability/assembly factor-like uncharacterized protein